MIRLFIILCGSIFYNGNVKKEKVRLSKHYEIEKTSLKCGTSETGLIYAFSKINYSGADSLIYGLILCPEYGESKNFNYEQEYEIEFRPLKKKDTTEALVLNAYDFRGKQISLVESVKKLKGE